MTEKINEGYPGDKLAKTRRRYIEEIERQRNIRTGYSCMKWILVILVFLCVLIFWYGKTQGWIW